jgi:hypothetical protein
MARKKARKYEHAVRFREGFRDAIKGGEFAPDDPILRLVLLVFADWLKDTGDPGSVYATPGVARLAKEVGLTKRRIIERLHQLDGVWFTRSRKGRGHRHRYSPKIPTEWKRVPGLQELRDTRAQVAAGNASLVNLESPNPTTEVGTLPSPVFGFGVGTPWTPGGDATVTTSGDALPTTNTLTSIDKAAATPALPGDAQPDRLAGCTYTRPDGSPCGMRVCSNGRCKAHSTEVAA